MDNRKLSLWLGVLLFSGIVVALIVCNTKKSKEPFIQWGKSYGAPGIESPYAGFLAPYTRPFVEGGYGASYMVQPKPGQVVPDCPYGFKPMKAESPYRGYWYCSAIF